MKNNIIALVVKPNEKPITQEINSHYKFLQNIVGGLIQVTYPYSDNVCIICNDEGKLDKLPLNRPLLDEEGGVTDVIAGTFIIVGLDPETEDFVNLSPEYIAKYSKIFDNCEHDFRYK